MKIECILELMKEKGYIDIYEDSDEPMPLIYRIKNNRGTEFGGKLFHAISKSEDYIADYKKVSFPEIFFAKKTEIDEWLETFTKEITEIRWPRGGLDSKILKYMKEKDFDAFHDFSGLNLTIINLKIKKERIKKIEEENQEAIDLLDQLL